MSESPLVSAESAHSWQAWGKAPGPWVAYRQALKARLNDLMSRAFILLGFSPKLSAVLSIMPTPVMGAIIVFVASFMIVSSLQIILSSKPDTRKTFVIGIPLIFGLSLQALPELYAQVVPWLRPLFGSALTLATVLAVGLNLLLRIGGATRGEASTISTEG